MFDFLNIKCLDIPRPLGAALGLVSILVMVAVQGAFLTVQLVQGLVFAVLMPMSPLALSWIVNHLYATPLGRVHVWAFQLYRRWFGRPGGHSQFQRFDFRASNSNRYAVHVVPCLLDNYCYLVVDLEGGPPHSCVAVDASDGPPVIEALRHLARTQYGGAGGAVSASPESNNEDATALQGRQSDPSVAGSSSAEGGNSTSNTHNGSSGAVMSLHDGFSDVLKLEAVLSTHRHWDHTFGNAHLLKHVNSCTKVYGGAIDQVPSCTHPINDGDTIAVGTNGLLVHVSAVPCHTRGSVLFRIPGFNQRRDAVFTGDTLFCGGCGAPFEGDATSMQVAFQKIWNHSSPGSELFPGHEYSEQLLPEFFKGYGNQPMPTHPQDYAVLSERLWISTRNRRSFNPPMPAVPVTLEVEMAYNPHFKGLHNAADTLSSILRRQRLAHSYGESGSGASDNNNSHGSELSRWRNSLTKKRTMMVVVPPGYRPGDSLEFSTEDGTNRTAAIVVPPGAVEGQKLKANVPPMSPREAGAAVMKAASRQQPSSLSQLQGQKEKQKQQMEQRAAAMQTLVACVAATNGGGDGLQGKSVGELKQLAASAGVSLAGCLEKEDVIGRLTSAAATVTASATATASMGGSGTDASSAFSSSSPSSGAGYDSGPASSFSLLPCPPGFDNEVWLNLPRPLQEEALEDLAKRYTAAVNGTGPPLNLQHSNSVVIGSGKVEGFEDDFCTGGDNDKADYGNGNEVSLSARSEATADSGFGDATSVSVNNLQSNRVSGSGSSSGGQGKQGETQRGAPSVEVTDSGGSFDFASIGSGGGLHNLFEDTNAYATAYSSEVTLQHLIKALHALAAGGDRIELRTLFRALTTLGSSRGTGAAGSKVLSSVPPSYLDASGTTSPASDAVVFRGSWRGMSEEEALKLIDAINYPHRILQTEYRDVPASTESLVIEYAAALLASVCDPSPEAPPPKASFLGMCLKCKYCPVKITFQNKNSRNGGSNGNGSSNSSSARIQGSGSGRPVRVESHDDTCENTAVGQEGNDDLESGSSRGDEEAPSTGEEENGRGARQAAESAIQAIELTTMANGTTGEVPP